MKWNKALKKISDIAETGGVPMVVYHRKYSHNGNDIRFGTVESLAGYEYKGKFYTAINTTDDQLLDNAQTVVQVLNKKDLEGKVYL